MHTRCPGYNRPKMENERRRTNRKTAFDSSEKKTISNLNLLKMLATSLNDSRRFPGSVFCFEHFIKNVSIIETQRAFRTHFNIHRNRSVPYHKLIYKWVTICRRMGAVTKSRSGNPTLSARTPAKINSTSEVVRENPVVSV